MQILRRIAHALRKGVSDYFARKAARCLSDSKWGYGYYPLGSYGYAVADLSHALGELYIELAHALRAA